MKNIYDKNRRPVCEGDVIKMYHFTSWVRREKIYMYKQVKVIKEYPHGTMVTLDHLGVKPSTWNVKAENQIREDWEIVQGFGGVDYPGPQDFHDRPKFNTQDDQSEVRKDNQGLGQPGRLASGQSEFEFPKRMEKLYRYHKATTEGGRVFFRGNRSTDDVLAMAEQQFDPYSDSKQRTLFEFDGFMDVGSGCGESCEIGADE